ncbi:sensor histidine kinase [Spirosoma fluviale]|uniref:histidine kinase n=1 Tax=Spirosoma fluviale TaxID=1597977 RepID=A0A286GBF2_9BACT|nr:PAS domain S-box protein [Spirosoma fluviale]SOD92853.1 PAS domain S-box-containing protein [Spirosoma fluviale]
MITLPEPWFDTLSLGIAYLKPVQNQDHLSTTFQCQQVNTTLAQVLSTTIDQLLEQPLDPFVFWVPQNEWKEQLLTVYRTGEALKQYVKFPHTNRWFQACTVRGDDQLVFSLQPVVSMPGEQSTDLPISTLQETNQLLQAVIQTSPTGLALLRPIWQAGTIVDFRYVLNNPQSAVITGLPQETMLGNRLSVLFPHLLANGVFDTMVRVVLTGTSQRFEILDELPSGAFWGDFTLVRVGSDVLFSVQDITHLKQIEEQLRQANRELEQRVAERTSQVRQLSAFQRAILTHAGLGITATDTKGIIQLVNPAMEALTGYGADELIDKVTPGFLRDPSVHQQQLDQLKETLNDQSLVGEDVVTAYATQHNFIRRENTLLTKDGRRIPVLATVSGLYDDQDDLMGFVDIATDISPLKTVEAALIQAQQRSQLAIKAGKLGIWEWNLATDNLELEVHFSSYFNTPEQAGFYRIGQVLQLTHPADLPYLKQALLEIKRGKRVLDIEFRIILPTTQAIHFLKVDGLLTHSETGSVPQVVGVVADRTTLRQSQLALEESEHRYRTLVNSMKEAVFQTDTAGLWTYLNPAWETITGFSVQESLGKLFLDYVLAEDQEHNQQLFEPMITRQKAYCRHEVRYIHKSGGYRWVEVFSQVTLNEQDELTGTTGTLTDITDRKQTEEILRDSEQRFREIAENVDELYWIRDLHSPKFLYMNPSFEKFSGVSVAELYQNPLIFADFIHEDDRAVILAAFMNNEPGTDFQFRVRHLNGTLRWLSARVFLLTDEAGRPMRRLGVASDITAVIEKEQILEESLAKERALNVLKSQFIATASHQFRTPLMAISSSVELIRYYTSLSTAPSSPVLINKHADSILRQVTSLDELIVDTLTLSKIEEGKVATDLEEIDVVSLCQELVGATFSDRSDGRQVELSSVGLPVSIQSDKTLLSHVLLNLLSNAFKYSTWNPRLTIRFCHTNVTLAIQDKGFGIPAKDLPFLFGKFFRASNVGQIKGTGLGLAICKEYVDLLGGTIDVESTEGVGTTFLITLRGGSELN